jgi:hypothetical protein
MKEKSKIVWLEPIVFLFFGLLHLHRVWALLDRNSYSDFWLSRMDNRDWLYFTLMGIMTLLCVAGIIIFIKNKGRNYWWRWFYIFGGGYVIFDLFAIFIRLEIWKNLLYRMFDVTSRYWNILWAVFICLGAASFIIGIMLAYLYKRQEANANTRRFGVG